MDNRKVGLFIKDKRIAKGITQQELANELFLDVTTISKWERGACFPDSGIITTLCKTLSINEHELFQACEDQEYRNIKKRISLIEKRKTTIFYVFTIMYAIAILTCFICNIAVEKKLSWFFIVLVSCLCGFSFFPTILRFFKKYKLEVFIISTFLSLSVLFITLSIYTNNYWCFSAIISVLLFYFIFFFPFIFFKGELIKSRIIRKYFLLIYSTVSLILLISLLLIVNSYYMFNIKNGILISVYCFTPIIISGLINIISFKIKEVKASIIVFISGLFLVGLNGLLNSILDPLKKDIYSVNFSNWSEYSNGNVTFILILLLSVSVVVLLVVSIFKLLKKGK